MPETGFQKIPVMPSYMPIAKPLRPERLVSTTGLVKIPIAASGIDYKADLAP